MSYPRSLDEIPRLELSREIRRREQCNQVGACDYCERRPESTPCRFPKRHAVKNANGYLRLRLEQLGAE